ncbi:HupE/UreJ family protein [Microvirga sp. M2]|uniref:HupE/UreJ family protein n=1 Tax=Microvirga sp. M2 TaxID=3073270 RepID=UPI0039C4B1BE
MTLKRSLPALPLMLAGMPAAAHTGLNEAPGFGAGFLHPLGGLDHVLAMLAVGLFAALLGGRALWAVPASFISMMLVGGAMGLMGTQIPPAEVGVAASVVVLGAMLAVGNRCLISVAMILTGMFAVFHGYVHGVEMPTGAAAALYCLGFASASALLHGAGLATGLVLGHRQMIRVAGALMSVAGFILALS